MPIGAGTEIAKLYATVGADTGEFDRKMGGVNTTLGGFVKGVAGLGAVVGGVRMATGAFKEMVGTAGDFEAQMNILEVAARSSGSAIEDLSAAAIAVGADTQLVGIDAAEAADALTGFYKAGLTTSDIFGGPGGLNQYLEEGTNLTGALRAAVDLAAASDLELAAASDAVAIAMATFGIDASQATAIADSFVGAADASVTEVGELTQALANVGPTAAQFGWSLEDTNTALALLSERGIRGSEAGTALKSMMSNMMRGTKDTVATLDKLNVSLYDSEGRMYDLDNIIGQLSSGMEGLTEEQRNSAIQTLAGTYGMKAMATLLEEGQAGWAGMEQSIEDAATAQEVGETRTQGLKGAMEQLEGSIQTFMINVGTPFIEKFLTPAAKAITDLVNAFTAGGLSGMIAELGEKISAAHPALESAITWLKDTGVPGLQTAFANFQSVVSPVTDWLSTTALPYVQDFVSGVVSSFQQEGLEGAFSTLTTKFTQLQADVGPAIDEFLTGLPAELDKIVTNISGWVTENAPKVGEKIKQLISDAFELYVDWMGLVVSLQTKIFDWVGGAIDWLAGKIPELAQSLATHIAGIGSDGGAPLLDPEKINELGGHFQSFIEGAIGFIADHAVPLGLAMWNGLVTVLDALVAKIVENMPTWTATIGAKLRDLLSAAAGWIKENVGPIVAKGAEAIGQWVTDLASHISSNWQSWISTLGEKLQELFSQAVEWVKDNVVPAVTAGVSMFTKWVSDMAGKASEKAQEWGEEWGPKIRETLQSAIAWVKNNLTTTVSQGWSMIKKFFEDLEERLSKPDKQKEVGEIIGTAIANILTGAIKLIALPFAAVSHLIEWLTSLFTDAGEEGEKAENKSQWGAILKGILDAAFGAFIDQMGANLDPYIDQIGGKFTSILAAIPKLDDIKNALLDFGGAMIDNIIQGIDDAKEKLFEWFKANIVAKLKSLIPSPPGWVSGAWGSVTGAIGGILPGGGEEQSAGGGFSLFAEGMAGFATSALTTLGAATTTLSQAKMSVREFIQMLRDLFGQMPEDASEKISAYADLLGDIVDPIADLIDALDALAGMTGKRIAGLFETGGQAGISAFERRMTMLFEFAEAVRKRMMPLARKAIGDADLEEFKAFEKLSMYADAISDAVSPIADLADALAALAAMAGAKLGRLFKSGGERGVTALTRRLEMLFTFADELFQAIVPLSKTWSSAGIGGVGRFAEAVVSALGTIAPAIQGLVDLFGMKGGKLKALFDLPAGGDASRKTTLIRRLDMLEELMDALMSRMVRISKQWSGIGLGKASAFASAVSTVLNVVAPAIEALNALFFMRGGKLSVLFERNTMGVSMMGRRLDQIVEFLDKFMGKMVKIAKDFGTKGLDAAQRFSQAADQVLSIFGGAIEALTGLLDYRTSINVDALGAALASDLQAIMEAFAWAAWQLRHGPAKVDYDTTTQFSEGVEVIMGAVSTAVDALTSLKEYEIGAFSVQFANILANIKVMIVSLYQTLLDPMIRESVVAAIGMAGLLEKVMEPLGAVIDTVMQFADYKELDPAKVTKFMEDVSTILQGVVDAVDVMFSVGTKDAAGMAFTLADIWERGFRMTNAWLTGMIQGIIDGYGPVMEAIASLVNNMVISAEQGLGIASGSKLFNQVGQNSVQGLVEGILARTQDAINAMMSLIELISGVSGNYYEAGRDSALEWLRGWADQMREATLVPIVPMMMATEAQAAAIQGGAQTGGSRTSIVIENMLVAADDPEEFLRQLQEIIDAGLGGEAALLGRMTV